MYNVAARRIYKRRMAMHQTGCGMTQAGPTRVPSKVIGNNKCREYCNHEEAIKSEYQSLLNDGSSSARKGEKPKNEYSIGYGVYRSYLVPPDKSRRPCGRSRFKHTHLGVLHSQITPSCADGLHVGEAYQQQEGEVDGTQKKTI